MCGNGAFTFRRARPGALKWTRFFSTSRAQLKRVSVLTGSKLINLTVAIAQHLSRPAT